MAATVHTDTLTDISAEETLGCYTRLVRSVRVTGLTATDYTTIFDALDEAGVPSVGDVPTGYENLRLVKRTPSVVENGVVDVRLEYQAKADAGYDFIFSGSASLNQINSQVDGSGNAITVQHTWPATDPDWPSETKVQGADINVLYPQVEVSATGIVEQDYPHYLADEWVACMNASEWAGGNAHKWLCTNVSWVPLDINSSPKKYQMTFTFQYNGKGWQPFVAFVDPRTGRRPPDAVAGVGYKTVLWYPELEYNDRFPV